MVLSPILQRNSNKWVGSFGVPPNNLIYETYDMNKPFSKGFVLRTTVRHMQKSIDISIRKTFERIQEFDSNGPKSLEVFETLSFLHTMRKMMDDFQTQNVKSFKG